MTVARSVRRGGAVLAGLVALAIPMGSAHAFGFPLGGGSSSDITMGGMKDMPLTNVQTWDGAYIGGHVGGAFKVGDDDDTLIFPTVGGAASVVSHHDSDYAFLGGLQLGYNFQSGSFVYGLEGDISFAEDLDYLASVRARFGIASGSTLVYATAGAAFIDGSREVTVGGTPGRVGIDSEVGYVVGGGIEIALDESTVLGGEALYYDFDADDITPVGFTSYSNDLDQFVARVRLSFKLSGGRPAFDEFDNF